MPQAGIIAVQQYSSTQDPRVLSPQLWGSCPNQNMEGQFQGIFSYNTFVNGTVGLISSGSTLVDANAAVTASTLPIATFQPGDHAIVLLTSPTASTGRAGVNARPIGPITPGGLPIWFECNVLPKSSTALQGFFIGLTNSTGTNNPGGIYSTLSGVSASNSLATNLPLVGFYMHGDTPNNCDAVFQASTGGLSTVLANVLTASTANPNPAFLQYMPNAAPGAFGSVAGINSTLAVKLGLNYVPQTNTFNFFVNGYIAASFSPTAAIFDVSDSFGPVATFAGNAQTFYMDFFAYASQWARS